LVRGVQHDMLCYILAGGIVKDRGQNKQASVAKLIVLRHSKSGGGKPTTRGGKMELDFCDTGGELS